MMAALFASRTGARVTLLEKNEKLGKKVYITGKGRCNVTNVCEDVQDFLREVASGSADVFQSIARIRKTDVLVGISFPRYSTRTLEAMRFAHECGAQVIGLTDGPMSPLHREADICLSARTDMTSFVDSLVAPLSVINALLVALALKKRKDLNTHLEKLEGIWDAYSVYINKENQ